MSPLRSAFGPPMMAALICLLASASAGAAGSGLVLADPTRPPGMATPMTAAATATARAPAAALEPVLPAPQVQALKLPNQGAAMALVDGHWLGVGDQVRGRRVLAIDRDGLLLQGKATTERLLLLAGTAKQAPGSIVINRSTAYVPQSGTDPAATGHAGSGMPAADREPGQTPGRAPSHRPGQTTEHPPGQDADKTQPMSVAGRNPP